jgi:hypothetical protein
MHGHLVHGLVYQMPDLLGAPSGTDTGLLCVLAVKLSAQVKQAVLEVEEYIRRENWPAIPHDIMKVHEYTAPDRDGCPPLCIALLLGCVTEPDFMAK